MTPHRQCPAFQGISFRDGTVRDFCKIPGSRDFPGRDLPHIFIPGFFGNCSGFFGIFLFDAIGDQFKHFSRAGKPNTFSAWLEMLWPRREIAWTLRKWRAVWLWRRTSRFWGRWDSENKHIWQIFVWLNIGAVALLLSLRICTTFGCLYNVHVGQNQVWEVLKIFDLFGTV